MRERFVLDQQQNILTATQLRRDIERLSGLYHISLLIGAGAEVSRVGELLTRKIARLLGAEMCVILLYDESEQSIYAQSPGYGAPDDRLRLLRSKLEERSIAAQVIKSGEPYLTNDVAHDPLISRAAADLLGARELLAVPLQAGARIIGALEVMNRPGGFLEEDRRIVTIFASQAAQLLANAQLLEKERRLAQSLIVSERLAAVGELIAGVAHEVRNPLCGITTTLSALARKLEDREAARPFFDVINTEVGHLNHLMEQLLEHSSPVRIDAEVADIREMIHEAMAEFKAQAEAKNITLVCECAPTAAGLRLDRRKMYGVFTNLLDNAIQHTGADGLVRITVSVSDGAVDGDEAGRLRIEVSDTGSGIAPENIDRVFEPFFTTRARGTGLGLAIARKTVHDHGGAITVKSEPGNGTSFILPLLSRHARTQRRFGLQQPFAERADRARVDRRPVGADAAQHIQADGADRTAGDQNSPDRAGAAQRERRRRQIPDPDAAGHRALHGLDAFDLQGRPVQRQLRLARQREEHARREILFLQRAANVDAAELPRRRAECSGLRQLSGEQWADRDVAIHARVQRERDQRGARRLQLPACGRVPATADQ
jgi:signal transduction histidine kinase